MTFNQFIVDQAIATARAEKAMMRRMSRRQSQRRALRRLSKKDYKTLRFED